MRRITQLSLPYIHVDMYMRLFPKDQEESTTKSLIVAFPDYPKVNVYAFGSHIYVDDYVPLSIKRSLNEIYDHASMARDSLENSSVKVMSESRNTVNPSDDVPGLTSSEHWIRTIELLILTSASRVFLKRISDVNERRRRRM